MTGDYWTQQLMSTIEERQRQRFRFLQALYRRVGDNEQSIVQPDWVARDIRAGLEEANLICNYLQGEGLVWCSGPNQLRITHRGIVEIEQALSKPEQPTEHFPPVQVIHIGSADHSIIQQGTHQSTATINLTTERKDELASLLKRLNESVDALGIQGEQQSELKAEVATSEAQLNSPKPKWTILGESLTTIRRVLEGAGGKLAADFLRDFDALSLFS